MNREVHVRFWEGVGVKFSRATQLYGQPLLASEFELNPEGMKVAPDILAEEPKFAPPDPVKYIGRSYLQQALKELG